MRPSPALHPAALLLAATLVPAAISAQEPYDYDANCRSWPAVEGPHAVGTAEFEVTDSLRGAQYAPSPTKHRRIYVRAWYPAAGGDLAGPRPYFTAAEATVLPGQLLAALQQPADALRGCASLASNSHQDAKPAPGRFPVVGFNHGYTSYPAQQSALFEHLAANGYVVLTVGHPYESGGLVYPGGDALTMSPRILQDMMRYAGATESMTVHYPPSLAEALDAFPAYLRTLRTTSLGQLAQVWQSDVQFVLDRLEAMDVPATAAGVAAAIDHGSRGYMGMSYGGYIAAMLAQGDRRAKAAVNLDGGYWTAELIDADLRTPFLMLNSDPTAVMAAMPAEFNVYRGPYGPGAPTAGDLAYERLATAGLRDDVHRIMIPGIQHVGISDFPEILRVAGAAPTLGEPGITAKLTAIQNDVVLGFLDRYVKGVDSSYPTGVLAKYPELMLRDRDDIRRQARALGIRPQGGTTDAAALRERIEGAQDPSRQGLDPLTIEEVMERFGVPGMSVAVFRDFEVHWAKGYGTADVVSGAPVDTETLFQAASISKPVTAMAALTAVEEGRFSLDEDINAILRSWQLPGNGFTDERPVTPRMLFSHTAGTGDGHGFPGYEPDAPRPTAVQILRGDAPSNVGAVSMVRPPLTAMHYSGGGTTIMQLALTDIFDEPFPEVMRRRVLEPVGMTRSTYQQPLPAALDENAARAHDRDGTAMGDAKWHVYSAMAAAGLWTTPTDLARFAIDVQKAARGDTGRVLTRSRVQEMLTPVGVGSYAVGFRIEQLGEGWYFSHSGGNWGFVCHLIAHKAKGYGLAVMTNSAGGAAVMQEVVERVQRAYGWDVLDKPVLR